MTHKPRGVFFDLYGTLLIPIDGAAPDTTHETLQRLFTEKGADTATWEANYATIAAPHCFRTDDLTRFECRLIEHCRTAKYTVRETELHYLADAICAEWQDAYRLDSDVIPLLETMQNAGMVVRLITNFDHPPHVRRVLEQTGLTSYFDKILVSGEEETEKPEPEILRRALEGTPLAAADTPYVGDSIVDYEAAVAAGMPPVIIRRPGISVHSDKYRESDQQLEQRAAAGELKIIASLSELGKFLFP